MEQVGKALVWTAVLAAGTYLGLVMFAKFPPNSDGSGS